MVRMSKHACLSVFLGWSLAFVGMLSGMPVSAQGYYSSFSEVKFDRAKGPTTIAAGVEVDAATGAASMNIPFGPGIGERGLKYRPMLSMRMAPQLRISSTFHDCVYYIPRIGGPGTIIPPLTTDTLYQSSFGSASIAPGTLDSGSIVSQQGLRHTTYSIPGGGGGRCGGGENRISVAEVNLLLTKFGFGADETVAYRALPVDCDPASRSPYLESGSDGHLIVGLRKTGDASQITDEVVVNSQCGPVPTGINWSFPRRMAVIRADVAYEYHYVSHDYVTEKYDEQLGQYSEKVKLGGAHYVLVKMRNRFGESIDFAYDADGIGYTATWKTSPSASSGPCIRVKVVDTVTVSSNEYQLLNPGYNVTKVTRIRVSYEGISQPVPSFILEACHPGWGIELSAASLNGPASNIAKNSNQTTYGGYSWDGASLSLQPMRVQQVNSDGTDDITFKYGSGIATNWSQDGWFNMVAPTVLTEVISPTRRVQLTWDVYRYRRNYAEDGILGGAARRPNFVYGVVKMDEWVAGGGGGTTIHDRVVPEMNWVTGPEPMGTTGTEEWIKTDFHDVVTHPDGTVSVHKFVGPTSLTAMKEPIFLKHIEREVRYYTNGNGASEVSISDPAQTTADKWVVKDHFSVFAVGGTTAFYPTRVRTYDPESQLLTTEEMGDWDATARGWKTNHATTVITSAPPATFECWGNATPSPTVPPGGVYRRVDKTFDSKVSDWIFARVKTEQSTVTDNSGFGESGTGPKTTTTYHSDVNRVEAVEVRGTDGAAVTTGFSYAGTENLAATQLASVYLSSPSFADSGKVGVSAYGYDELGRMNLIAQKPNEGTSLTVQQTSDELGRPISQTDMNGTVKSFEWDSRGRLRSISIPDEETTTIDYDDDHRGATVTRGRQVSGYRYNGFGLILENRKGPDGQWSHRIHGYNNRGLNTGETVWLPGDGRAQEAEWSELNLTQDIEIPESTVTTPERTVCKKWGLDPDGNAVCLSWQTIPPTTTTRPATTKKAHYAGVAIGFDARRRVIRVKDANGMVTTTEYLGAGAPLPPGASGYVGPFRKITVGSDNAQFKWFENDVAGRLVRVTTPVKGRDNIIQNLRTEYRYDSGGRIRQVRQFDASGQSQTRTWAYNGLGWLTRLEQPESGVTTYHDFTVAGKPRSTSYAGRVVTTMPDWMGRPIAVTGDNGLTQAFSYDTAIDGKGLLATSTDTSVLGRVTTTFGYGGLGKRLGNLKTKIETKGITQEFTQTFGYDTYGNRDSGHTSHAPWAQSYHFEAGLPKQLTVGTNVGTKVVADTPWGFYDPTSWALKNIAYGNNAKSAFDYDADQTRLKGMTHLDGAQTIQENWAYTYNDVGNLIREDDKNRPDGNNSYASDRYGYDELNRLVSAVVQSQTLGEQMQQFDYDGFGNRIASSIHRVLAWSADGKSTASVANSGVREACNAAFSATSPALAARNQLPTQTTTGADTGANYDNQGNLTQIFDKLDPNIVLTMEYDALGRVTSVTHSGKGIREEYIYRADGLRTVVHEYQNQVYQKSRVQIYNDARQLVAQYERIPSSSLATWKRDIVYLGAREAAEIDVNGMHVTQVDHLGSPRVITGPSGVVESKQKYLPFGEFLEQTVVNFASAKGYTGHEQTDASGLIYMQARFYVPWFGRFASPDPGLDQHFEQTQSWNIYSYVRNSPVMMTDPTGMETKEDKEKKRKEKPGPGDPNHEYKGREDKILERDNEKGVPKEASKDKQKEEPKHDPTSDIAAIPGVVGTYLDLKIEKIEANPGPKINSGPRQVRVKSLAKKPPMLMRGGAFFLGPVLGIGSLFADGSNYAGKVRAGTNTDADDFNVFCTMSMGLVGTFGQTPGAIIAAPHALIGLVPGGHYEFFTNAGDNKPPMGYRR